MSAPTPAVAPKLARPWTLRQPSRFARCIALKKFSRRPAFYGLLRGVRTLLSATLIFTSTFALAQSSSDVVLLDFYSKTCGPCQHMHPIIDQLRSSGMPIRPVDVEREPALARQYGVTGVPCFVLVAGDREIDRVVGATSAERLKSMFASVGMRSENSPRTVSIPRSNLGNGASNRTMHGQATSPSSTMPNLSDLARTTPNGWLPISGPYPTSQFASRIEDQSSPINSARSNSTASVDESGNAPALREKLRRGTVRLVLKDSAGRSFGSGVVIHFHQGEALIVTCGHLFANLKEKPNIQVDFFSESTVRSGKGLLLGYDVERDVGLVAAKAPGPVEVLAVASPTTAPAVGSPAFSVGCNHGEDPTVWPTHITAINKYLGPANIEAAREPMQGRSGGGLFNTQGELIGICNAADPADKEGLYSALENVWWALGKYRLAQLLQPFVQDALAMTSTASEKTIPHTQPSTETVAGTRSNEELAAQMASGDAEVICIVRPKGIPAAKPQVLVLDRPSKAFLNELTVESTRQDTRQLTAFSKTRPRPAPLDVFSRGREPSVPNRPSGQAPPPKLRQPVRFDAPLDGLQPIYR